MSDLDPKIFKFTFGDIIRNVFSTKKSSYQEIKVDDKINKTNNRDNTDKRNYGSIS